MMTIRHIHRYRLAFRAPVPQPHGALTHREGVIVGVVDARGARFVGEAAPLPGFSRETVDEVEAFFETLRGQPLDWLGEPLRFAEQRRAADWAPSIACALETVHALSLQAVGALPTAPSSLDGPLRCYALASSVEHAAALAEEGFRSLKLKLDATEPSAILASLEGFRAAVGSACDFRVDANQRWSMETARAVVPRLGRLGVVALEEPLDRPTPQTIRALRAGSSVPIFADESIRSPSDLVRWNGAFDGLVLKPMFAGGPLQALLLARMAIQRGMQLYVTTALDAAVGRRLAAWTARLLPGGTRLAHGLGTGKLLLEDVGPELPFSGDELAPGALADWDSFAVEVWRRCF